MNPDKKQPWWRGFFLTHEGLSYLRAVLTAAFVLVLGAAAFCQSRHANTRPPQSSQLQTPNTSMTGLKQPTR